MKTKSVRVNMIMNALLTMSSFIFQIITFPYASRVLGPDGIGKSSFAISLVSYFVLFSQLGIPTYGVVACAKIRNDRIELSKTVRELLSINLVLSGIVYSVFYALLFSVPRLSVDKPVFIVASTTILFNTIGIEWLYKALEQYSYITKRSIAFKLIGFILLFLTVKDDTNYVMYTAVTVIASYASQVINFFHARKIVDFNIKVNLDCKRHLKSVMIFFAMSCATTIYTHLDSVMLGFMKADEVVGYYNAAVKMKSFIIAIVTSIGTVLLPRASYYISNGQEGKFRDISHRALLAVLIVGSSTCLYFIIFAQPAIVFLSGTDFIPSVLPMRIIMPTVLFIGLSNILGIQMLIPLGKEKLVLKSEIIGAVVNVILNASLIPTWGASGAAIGTLFAELSVTTTQAIELRSDMAMSIKGVKWHSYFVVLLSGSILSLFLSNYIHNSLLKLIVSAIVFYSIIFVWALCSGTLEKIYGKQLKIQVRK